MFVFKPGNRGFAGWVALSGLMLLLLVGVAACATEAPVGDVTDNGTGVTVSDPWVRAGMAGRPTAAYMVITNNNDAPDRLVSASAQVADETQIHESRMGDDGEMMMVHMAEGLEVPAGGELVLKPESFHVMLLGLSRDLVEGEAIPIVLMLEDAGTITVPGEVRAMAAMDGMGDG